MDSKLKALGIAGLVGGATYLGSEQLAKTQWMQQHPEAWYVEAVAAGLVAYLLRKKNSVASTALASAAFMLAVQGYEHRGGAAPGAAPGGSMPQSTPQSMPQGLPAPANGNPGVVPKQLPTAQPGQQLPPSYYQPLPSAQGTVPSGEDDAAQQGADFVKKLIENGGLGENPFPDLPDFTGALLRQRMNRAGALLRQSAMQMGQR